MKDNLDVKIVRLEPLRVATTLGFGEGPEGLAWDKLMQWAEPRGLMTTTPPPRLFGFNNPDPMPGNPVYGYEVWMTVGPEIISDDVVQVKDFSGGLYAVTRCTGTENIFPTWQKLVAWVENSPHQSARHQWLEEHLKVGSEIPESEFVLDLYLPIVG
ncbi:MAG TPA: GyrI-like domain-containing protein [Phototrophicaceae bacterium]|nr:GyrI-like domain-containing protein [Phototrophicaceae bacterium]